MRFLWNFFLLFAVTNPNVNVVQAGKKGNFIRYETTLVMEKYPCFIENFNTLKFLSFQLFIGIFTSFSPFLNAKHRFETKVILSCGVRETKQQKVMWDTLSINSSLVTCHVYFCYIFQLVRSYFIKWCTSHQDSSPDVIVLTAFFNLLCSNIWKMNLET